MPKIKDFIKARCALKYNEEQLNLIADKLQVQLASFGDDLFIKCFT